MSVCNFPKAQSPSNSESPVAGIPGRHDNQMPQLFLVWIAQALRLKIPFVGDIVGWKILELVGIVILGFRSQSGGL
jgi:hypothetical protein